MRVMLLTLEKQSMIRRYAETDSDEQSVKTSLNYHLEQSVHVSLHWKELPGKSVLLNHNYPFYGDEARELRILHLHIHE
jgi:hypothetical protein